VFKARFLRAEQLAHRVRWLLTRRPRRGSLCLSASCCAKGNRLSRTRRRSQSLSLRIAAARSMVAPLSVSCPPLVGQPSVRVRRSHQADEDGGAGRACAVPPGGNAPRLTQRKPKRAFSTLWMGAEPTRWKPGIAEEARDVQERGWPLIRRRARSDSLGLPSRYGGISSPIRCGQNGVSGGIGSSDRT
jgi:hypothetical protein